ILSTFIIIVYFYYSYVSSAWTTTTSWTIDPTASTSHPKINPVQARVDKLLIPYTKQTIVTDIDTTRKSVVRNILNLGKQTSKIIQEI
ncbi:unnamed protein product, partial [marine sediment metagenome]